MYLGSTVLVIHLNLILLLIRINSISLFWVYFLISLWPNIAKDILYPTKNVLTFNSYDIPLLNFNNLITSQIIIT